jgi:hypothetical protein
MKVTSLLSALLLVSASSLAAADSLPANQIRMGWSFTVDGASSAIGSGEMLASLVTATDHPELYAVLTDPLDPDYATYSYSQPFQPLKFYSVIDISGTIDGSTITSGASFIGYQGFNSNDNLLMNARYLPSQYYNPLTFSGISFRSDAATDNAWNVYYDYREELVDGNGDPTGGYAFHYRLSNTLADPDTGADNSQTGLLTLAVLERPVDPIPLPAGVWLLASGLGALGAAARRRRTV